MFLKEFEGLCRIGESIEVKLPWKNLKLDPRANNHPCTFDCVYHNDGITVTLTRNDEVDHESDVGKPFTLRVYDPAKETVPDFDSTTYSYSGVDGERAPRGTVIGIIEPSVKCIKKSAFACCRMMKKCIMFDKVEIIEKEAFTECEALQVIRLSRNLRRIEHQAFSDCYSLEALFLPPSVEDIEMWAFADSRNIRILPLPPNIDIQRIGREMIYGCDNFFRITQIQPYEFDNDDEEIQQTTNDGDVYQSIIDFYRNMPSLHKACLDTNVSGQSIRECISIHGTGAASIADHDGMTPLHILAMNPHADVGSILACFHASMTAAFGQDRRGRTPMDYLREYNLEGSTAVMSILSSRQDTVGAP